MSKWELKNADLATFKALDAPTRRLILRLLDEPTDKDWTALQVHPNSKMLATWLLQQPAFRDVSYDDE